MVHLCCSPGVHVKVNIYGDDCLQSPVSLNLVYTAMVKNCGTHLGGLDPGCRLV